MVLELEVKFCTKKTELEAKLAKIQAKVKQIKKQLTIIHISLIKETRYNEKFG